MANYYTDLEKELAPKARKWASGTRRQLRASSARFRKGKVRPSRIKTVYIPSKKFATKTFQVREEKLKNSFKYKVRARRGVPDRITIQMAYHAFFKERGLGKGRRSPEPFLNPVLEKRLAELADHTQQVYADAAVKAISF